MLVVDLQPPLPEAKLHRRPGWDSRLGNDQPWRHCPREPGPLSVLHLTSLHNTYGHIGVLTTSYAGQVATTTTRRALESTGMPAEVCEVVNGGHIVPGILAKATTRTSALQRLLRSLDRQLRPGRSSEGGSENVDHGPRVWYGSFAPETGQPEAR
jgi:hypothetical protein